MSDKVRIAVMAAIVIVLALVWWIGGRTSKQAEQRTFREHLLRVDTAALSAFTIVPSPSRRAPALHFQRDSLGWTATADSFATRAFFRPMNELLATLVDVRPLRMAGDDPATIARYGLIDSLAPQLELPNGSVLRVGTSSGGAEPVTAVMLQGDPNVYLVPGKLDHLTGMTLDDWVPKPMVNGDPGNWRRVTFVFPGSRSYSLEKNGSNWTLEGQAADSTKVAKYLWALSRYYGSGLVNPADTLSAMLIYSMRVEDSSRKDPIILGIFDAGGYLIARSTLAPSWLVMPFDPQQELPRMFRPPEAFL